LLLQRPLEKTKAIMILQKPMQREDGNAFLTQIIGFSGNEEGRREIYLV
jgi:hypothetical protein